MSISFHAFVAGLFGLEDRSDCTIVFYCGRKSESESPDVSRPTQKEQLTEKAPDEPNGQPEGESRQPAADEALPDDQGQPAKRRKIDEAQPAPLPEGSTPIGKPLPAHKVVLLGGSPRFRAQLDRWTQEQGSDAKPVLRVPLDGADELPHALSAVQFMYTGKLDVSDAPLLLRVRRQAAYLQVEGCAEACDAALLASVTAPQPVEKQQQQQQAGALAGVAQLYGTRELLASVEPAVVHKLLHTCRQQLVKHSGSAAGGQSGPAAGPSSAGSGAGMGKLLAWAFGDAPSLMSDPETREQMEALPAAAMEALLGCDSFATDNEATVLLMLLTWLEVNTSTNADTRKRLLKLVRLSQLSDAYLLRLLPLLTCFNLSSQELRLLQEFAAASDSRRARMKGAAGALYDFSSAWYHTVSRPAPDWKGGVGRRLYVWCVDALTLKAALTSQEKSVRSYGKFANGGSRVVANGFEWYPEVQYTKGGDAAGVYLFCSLPSSLGLNLSPKEHVLVNPGSCRLVVFKGGSDGGRQREEAWSLGYGTDADFVEVGSGWGRRKALPLGAPPSAPLAHQQTPAATTASAGDPQLARWAPYIRDGRLWGYLNWREE